MAKPDKHLDWTDGSASKVQEPPTGKKELGWTGSEKPPFEWMNWLFYKIDQWNKYFESISDQVLANGSVYDAVVGVGGTHNSIPELLTDPDIATKKNVLVISPFTLNTTIDLNQNDMTFTFKPQATLSKATAQVAIEINANRVKIYGCRFQNFDGGSDECIRINSSFKYNIIRDCHFFNNTLTINDQGEGNVLSGNIEEV